MAEKAIRPYLIFMKHPETQAFRVFTSNDPCKEWDPAKKGTLELKALGLTVFKARHSDIMGIHDLQNELLQGSKFQKEHASVMVDKDGNPLN